MNSQGNSLAPNIDEIPKVLPKTFGVLLIALLLLWAVSPLTPLYLLFLAYWATKGPKESIQALTLLVLLLLINRGIASVMSYQAGSLRWLVLFAAFGRMLWDTIIISAPTPKRILLPLLLFSLVTFVFALLVSYIPAVSILKIVTFTVGVCTVFISFHRTPHLQQYWKSWFVTIFIFIVVLSLPLYGSPMGNMRSVGFQGILLHPQSYGPVLAPFTAWFTGLALFKGYRSYTIAGGIALGWLGIFTSLARTSFMMLAGSLAIAFLVGILFKPAWRIDALRAVSGVNIVVFLFVLFGTTLLYGPQISESLTEFLLKGETEESFSESFEGSRGFLIQLQLENFEESPLMGIGFGVPSTTSKLRIVTEGPLNLPTGASVEKGFMPSAVLEETGIVGALMVIFILGVLISTLLKYGSLSLLVMLIASLLVNFGEMVFFSVGGLGLFFWLLIGFSYSQANNVHLLKRSQNQHRMDRSQFTPHYSHSLPRNDT